MQLFPENVRRFWNGWEIRILVLVSLILQTILTMFGSRRKFTSRIWLRILVWLAYLSADWVATVVLGNLATSDGDCDEKSSKSNDELHAFWAPFLLLHLGGPDTITAYALEDNELWLRHLLALFVQVAVAFYVFLRHWSNTAFTFMAIPIFIVASIRYGERTLVLRSSSNENFKEVLLVENKSGSELVSIMKGRIKKDLGEVEHSPLFVEAYLLLKRFAFLFAGQLLSNQEEEKSYKIFKTNKSAEDAFNLVEVELGFMYDLLYTKAHLVYSGFGILLRCFSLFCSISVLVAFPITTDIDAYQPIDVIITYLLLVGTVALEVYTFFIHFFSDWIRLYFFKYKNANSLSLRCLGNHKRWSGSMGQFNLINFCIKEEMPVAFAVIGKLFGIKKSLENHRNLTWDEASVALKELIFKELMEKINKQEENRPFCLDDIGEKLLAQRGSNLLKERYNILDPVILWLTGSAPYDCSLVSWHIATDICYYMDLDKRSNGNPENLHPRCKISKCLSEYMLYLLVLCPTLMPEGSDAWYRHTYEDFKFDLKKKTTFKPKKASEIRQSVLEEAEMDSSIVQQMATMSPSAVVPGSWLGQQLQMLESNNGWNYEKKWEMISEVWVEMLAYAASHGAWNAHGQYLRRGGELLTHVRLLMAHLGLSSQYGLITHNYSILKNNANNL